MAKLSWHKRKLMPKSEFAIPSRAPASGSYPINDETHARSALQRVSQFGDDDEKAEVRSAVKRKFSGIKIGGK